MPWPKGKPTWNKGLNVDTDKRVKPAWNKGLTKDVDNRVLKYSETMKGHLVSEETRTKLRNVPRLKGSDNPLFGILRSKDTCQKISDKAKGRKWTLERRDRCSAMRKGKRTGKDNSMYGKRHTPEAILKMRQSTLDTYKKRPELKTQIRETAKANFIKHPEKRLYMRQVALKLWQDKDYAHRVISNSHRTMGSKKSPSSPEQKMIVLLETILPGEYKFTGNSGIIIGEVCPDFCHISKNKIIEVFGRYWHTLQSNSWHQTEIGRIEIYKQCGYQCLVVWEEELNKDKENILIKKIIEFTNDNYFQTREVEKVY